MDLSLRDENEIVLRDGSTTHVRSTSPDDADLLRDLLERLSPDALWLRLLGAGVSYPAPDAAQPTLEHSSPDGVRGLGEEAIPSVCSLWSTRRRVGMARQPDGRGKMPAMQVWTIGHSTHPIDAFVALLVARDIAQVADIRTVPKSRRHPHFHTDALARSLRERGVAYAHLPRLGGWRRPEADSPNGGWRSLSFRGYADYAMGEEFARGLAQLRQLAAAGRTAVMCSEALWWRCHRRLVADRLVIAGDSVCHISADGRASAHHLTPFATVEPDGQITYPAGS